MEDDYWKRRRAMLPLERRHAIDAFVAGVRDILLAEDACGRANPTLGLPETTYQEEPTMAERVRAKMFCQEVRHSTYGGGVTLQVVTRGEDNKAWAAATPSGEMKLSIKNELAIEFFKDRLGQEFYVDIVPVPDSLQGQEGMGE